MQIKNITLYKDSDNIRIVPFEIGKVNIITGESKSGKTALIDIVDYCLGSKDCKIADGVQAKNVYWFCITLWLNENEEIFIARLNPTVKGVTSVSQIYVVSGKFDSPPAFDTIEPNTNIDGLSDFLSRKLNIADNLQIAESNTRDALVVNFRHSRLFCFQPQDLIAGRELLFYNQRDTWVSQAIKDSLPYFLGAIREDSLIIEQELAQLKRDLNRLIRAKNEAEKIKGEDVGKAFSLINEAKEIGILSSEIKASSIDEALETLNSIKDWELPKLNIKPVGEDTVLKQLLEQRQDLKLKLSDVDDTLSATSNFIKNNTSFTGEVRQQQIRLESIHLFSESNANNSSCPLCNNQLEVEIPSVSAINQSLSSLNNALQFTINETPRLTLYLDNIKKDKEKIEVEITKIENSINALYNENENKRTQRDLNLRKGRVIGRISLYLESVDFIEDNTIDSKISLLRSQVEEKLLLIDKESKEQKLASIINKVNLQMSMWVKEKLLDTEYEDSYIRFDVNKLTLYSDTKDNRSIPLIQVGSGANWVSYHLLIHFALHLHFLQSNRPVPHFLMLDQPSQVYFPPTKDPLQTGEILEDADEIAVRKMFDFIIDITAIMAPNFQVIVTDHAHLQNDKFNSCIIEIWRDGTRLIPEEWYISSAEDEILS